MALAITFTGTPGNPSASTGGPLEIIDDITAAYKALNDGFAILGVTFAADGTPDAGSIAVWSKTELASVVDGSSGADKVGSTALAYNGGGSATAQSQLEALDLSIGNRNSYTEENYITNNEAIVDSVDALDVQVKTNADGVASEIAARVAADYNLGIALTAAYEAADLAQRNSIIAYSDSEDDALETSLTAAYEAADLAQRDSIIAYSDAKDDLKANIASPTFTGTVTLPSGQVVNSVELSTIAGITKFLRGDGSYASVPATGTPAAVDIGIDDVGDYYTGTEVETALQEVGADLDLKAPLADPTFTGTVTLPAGQVVNDVTLTNTGSNTLYLSANGTYKVPVLLAESIYILDTGGYYTGTDVEAALQEVGASVSALEEVGTIVTEATTARTLVLSDKDKYIDLTSASDTIVTVPPNADVAFPIGTTIIFERNGAGEVDFAAGIGVTINSMFSYKSIDGQYGQASLTKKATNTWTLAGALKA